MENNSFCRRMIEAANARPGKVAMTLIGPGGAETTPFGEMLSRWLRCWIMLPAVSDSVVINQSRFFSDT
jgi:hypothetical protein